MLPVDQSVLVHADVDEDAEGGSIGHYAGQHHARGQVLHQGEISLKVNGEVRQRGNLADMIWSVPEIIADLSTYYHLQAGDLIYTGTPEGVGPVQIGDRLEGQIEGVGSLRFDIGAQIDRAHGIAVADQFFLARAFLFKRRHVIIRHVKRQT